MSAWLPASASRALALAAAAIGCVAYALLAHHAASAPHPGMAEAAIIVVPLLALAFPFAWQASPRLGTRAAWVGLWLAAVVACYAGREWLVGRHNWLLLLQHLGINLLVGLLFARSLRPGATPLVTLFAHFAHGGAITPRVERYTRGVILAWVMYFWVTFVVSLLLYALAPATVWSTFVNLLSLPLMGAMFAGEYLVRVLVIPREERSGFVDALRGYRRWTDARAGREPS